MNLAYAFCTSDVLPGNSYTPCEYFNIPLILLILLILSILFPLRVSRKNRIP